jgi:uncharacterized protein
MPDLAAGLISRPHAMTQFVLKVHARCDLACDHCYVYEHADQSWRRKDRVIAQETVRVAATRIAEHAAAWQVPSVSVIVHGGEPLLLTVEQLRAVLGQLRTTIAPVTRLNLVMQTNGVRLTEAVCEVLLEFGVRVGVSLDGDRAANDRHRRFANGTSSYAQVRRALALLRQPAYRSLYGGILCTIDVRNDPIAVYEALAAESPPRLDFLLPHATWDAPPLRPTDAAGRHGPRANTDPTPYATWLDAIYRRWSADGRPMRIRMFDSLRSTAGGGPSGTEQLGTDAADVVVIDTDGSWEQADSLKTAFDGAPDTGCSVFAHSVDDVSRHPEIHQRQLGLAGLSETCRACPVVQRCGGGLYAHRYRTGSGFDNPSVFCADLKELIRRVDRIEEVHAARSAQTETSHLGFLDQLGSGTGDAAAIRWLAETQLAITRGLLVAVADAANGIAVARDGWHLLADIDEDTPQAVLATLAHPYLRVWAAAVLRDDAAPDRFAYLASIAAAAGLRAGVEAELVVPVREGRIFLPTLGTVQLTGAGDGHARISLGHHGFTVRAGEEKRAVDLATGTQWWLPAHRIVLDGLDVLLEDADPYRDCHQWAVTSPLAPTEVEAWRQQTSLAWKLIEHEVPAYVPGLREGLRAIVPLDADPAGMKRASTARDAFGAVAAAPSDHSALAVMLVHEFQHSKLGAVLDLYDLFDPDSTATMAVGWRPDRRPIEGALQGTYAHLSVAQMWRVRADAGQPEARPSYLQYRDWTLAAVDGLRDSGALTPLGERFVERMAAATEDWP